MEAFTGELGIQMRPNPDNKPNEDCISIDSDEVIKKSYRTNVEF